MKTFKLLSLSFALWGASINASSFMSAVPEFAKDTTAFVVGSSLVLPSIASLLGSTGSSHDSSFYKFGRSFMENAPHFIGASLGFGATHYFNLPGELVVAAAFLGAGVTNYSTGFCSYLKNVNSLNKGCPTVMSWLVKPLLVTAAGFGALYGAAYAGLATPNIKLQYLPALIG